MTRRVATAAALVTTAVLVQFPIRLIATDGLKTVPYRSAAHRSEICPIPREGLKTGPIPAGASPVRIDGMASIQTTAGPPLSARLNTVPHLLDVLTPVGDGLPPSLKLRRTAEVLAEAGQTVPHVAYLMIDATTGSRLALHWADPDRALPVGSLIKPFTALAYAVTHRFEYPTFVCRGTADGCWLPSGHGSIGIVSAIGGSCNAYFRHLSISTPPETLVSTLWSYGMTTDRAAISPQTMVGLGDALKLTPAQVAHGYAELVARAGQPGVSPILQGMRKSARTGTGRAAGAAVGAAGGFVKTGTAPCVHSPNAGGDGYAVVVYPADRPRVVLLVQAHGRTGAEAAGIAGDVLTALELQ